MFRRLTEVKYSKTLCKCKLVVVFGKLCTYETKVYVANENEESIAAYASSVQTLGVGMKDAWWWGYWERLPAGNCWHSPSCKGPCYGLPDYSPPKSHSPFVSQCGLPVFWKPPSHSQVWLASFPCLSWHSSAPFEWLMCFARLPHGL